MPTTSSHTHPVNHHSLRTQLLMFAGLTVSFGLLNAIPIGEHPDLALLGGLIIRAAAVLLLVQVGAWMGRMRLAAPVGIAAVLAADTVWLILLYWADGMSAERWAANWLLGWALLCAAPQISQRLWINVAGLVFATLPMFTIVAISFGIFCGFDFDAGWWPLIVLVICVMGMPISAGTVCSARIIIWAREN